jgi:hypothetical protein
MPIDALDIATDDEKAAQAKFERELFMANSRDLKLSKGEEIDLSSINIPEAKKRKV